MADEPKAQLKKPVDREEMRVKVLRYPRWVRPLVWTEWGMEWAAYGLSELAFFAILEYIGKLSIIVAVVFYFLESPTRRKQAQNEAKQAQYDAWRVIASNEGKSGSGGRIQALQDLNEGGVSLNGVDLHKASLRGINLQSGELGGADLRGADLSQARLSWAKLVRANLSEAEFTRADLSRADLSGADLSHANLIGANLSGASLFGANFERANLWEANLKNTFSSGAKFGKALLVHADLRGTHLAHADLSEADLSGADLGEADLSEADLSEARHLTQAQVDSAKGSEITKLPKGLVRPHHWSKSRPQRQSKSSTKAPPP